MGHVMDQWTSRPPQGGKRVRNDRWGRGKRWLARWTDPAGRERSKAFAAKDAAEAHLVQVESAMHSGAWVGPSRLTFDEVAQAWLGEQVHLRRSSAAGARTRLASLPFGGRRVGDVTRGDVQALIVEQSERLAPATVHQTYYFVQAVFKHAVHERLIVASPCERIRLPKVVAAPAVLLTPEQVKVIADRMVDEGGRNGRRLGHFRAMVLVGAATGLRPGELRGLTWDRVGPGGLRVDRQLVLTSGPVPVFGPPKTASSVRTVPLAASTRALLERVRSERGVGPEGLVFFRPPGSAVLRSSLKWSWVVGSQGLGLPPGSGWHMLRHHHASLLIGAGLSPRAVADRLGHKDAAETLNTYSHLWPSDQARALAAIEDVYGDADVAGT